MDPSYLYQAGHEKNDETRKYKWSNIAEVLALPGCPESIASQGRNNSRGQNQCLKHNPS